MNMNMVQETSGYVPPQEVQSNAKRGLELRQKHGRGGTEVGIARARNLSNGDSIPLDTINRMVSYFARHEVDKKGEGWGTDSAGYIAWLLWGGDAGRSWAEKIARQADDDESAHETVGETGMYGSVSEVVPNDAPDDDFAYVPNENKSDRKLYIGDAKHATLAVQAITTGLEGNKAQIPNEHLGAVKAKIKAAIAKFYKDEQAKYYDTWLSTGKKPDNAQAVTEIRLSTPSFAFRGQYPDIPLAPGVDQAALTNDDPRPLYVVRPLAILGAVSDNGLKYDDRLLTEIEQQVKLKKPAARQGHVSEEASSYEFPADVGLWVGALRVGDTLFGKAYIYPGTQFHQMVTKRKAAGSTLSNSIWGKGHFEPNADGTQSLRDLDLESIDFAPAERAALSDLGGQFETTSEMRTNGVKEMSEQHGDEKQDLALIRKELAKHVKEMAPHALHELMTDEQRQHCAKMCVREMEPSAVYEMLPQAHKAHIHECYAKEFGQKLPAAEMSGVAELKKSIAEMQSQIAEYKQREFDDTLAKEVAKPFETWNVKKGSEQEKVVASAQENFKFFVVAEMATLPGGQKLGNIARAAEVAWPKFEPQAALLRTALTGGNAIISTKGTIAEQRMSNAYGWNPQTGRYDENVASSARDRVAPK